MTPATPATLEAFSNAASCRYAVPEIALAIAPLLVVAWDLFAPGAPGDGERNLRLRRRGVLALTLGALAVSAVGSARMLVAKNAPGRLLFDGQLACDGYASGFRLFFALVTAFVALAAIPTREAKLAPHGRGAAGAEMFALLLAACLGMNLMAMGRTLLTLYVGIELVSFASFGLAALRLDPGDDRRRKSAEGALKYVVFGGVASGVMLYGMSWMYGATQSIVLPEIAERIAALTREQGHLPNALAIAIACVMAGLGYKVASVPFHMWAPDVYEASPTLVSAFFAVGPQVAGLAALLRFFREGFGAPGALPEWQAPWPILAGAIALVTMTVGNLGALGQTNLKRLLAYAGVAQAGTMLLAFSAPGDEGVAAIAFYLVPYAAVSLGAFVVVLAVSEAVGDETVDALRGLGARAPGMAAALAVFLFSLVGVPPFAGFVSKLYVIAALLRSSGDFRSFYFFLAIAGVGNTVVSLVFCARILRAMYLTPASGEGGPVSVRRLHAIMTATMVVPTVFLGVWWAPLYDFLTRTVTMIP
jgi:NADH-quinone oxidoreductase subunit N